MTSAALPSAVHKRPQVLYDGDCAFCVQSVRLLRLLDWTRYLDYVDMRQKDQPLIQALGGPSEELLEQMHVLPPGRRELLHGYDAIRWLLWRLPMVCWLAPFLYVPGVPGLGRKVYEWIARHRFRLVPCRHGVCQIQHRDVSGAGSTDTIQ